MKADIFIGIDMGSSSLKAVAFESSSAAAIAAAGSALPHVRRADGACELSESAIRVALVSALRGVTDQLGPRVAQVRAIGCTGHGAGLYALGASGQLLRGFGVASTDQRAARRAAALARAQGDTLFDEVGCRPWAGQPLPLLAELLAHGELQPSDIRHLLFAKDYLAYLLTGHIATDASDASTAGLLALATGGWSQTALQASGVAELVSRALPPLLPSGSVIGSLHPLQATDCGLPAGLPVAMVAIDLLASLTAVGAQQSGMPVAVLGTWCVNVVMAPRQHPKPAVAAIVDPRLGSASEEWLYMENSPSSMANMAWLARQFGWPSAAAVVDAAMASPLGAQGLRFAPFINGGGPFAGVEAAFLGLSHHHGRTEMARAVVDAVMALHAYHLRRLASLGLGSPGRVAVLGGGARDHRLVQLLATMLGHPVQRCGDDETGARGAALWAARSQGLPAEMLQAPADVVEPDTPSIAAHQAYCAGFERQMRGLADAFASQNEVRA
ncbi:FGGY family carbohydrate kinase [Ideonella sp. DXS29W]|uniref:FGGY family carbohydrate kinase n=1 Tax=Ideonella lacteola TaxID=2984193 RepID=A0ABU9BGW9_9BURK